MWSRVYETVERPSVRPSHRSAAAAAGLLLWARRPGDIDRIDCCAVGAQQQMRAVSRCQLTREAEPSLVSVLLLAQAYTRQSWIIMLAEGAGH